MVTAATLDVFNFGAGVADGNIEAEVSQLYKGTRTSNHFSDTSIDAERGCFEGHAISCFYIFPVEVVFYRNS